MSGKDEYVYGPESSFYLGKHYLGSVSFGRKRKNPGQPGGGQGGGGPRRPAFGAPMRIAGAVIAAMLGADLISSSFHNGAEIAWVALGGVVTAAVTVPRLLAMRRRSTRAAGELAVRQAVTAGSSRPELEQKLAQTQAVLAEVLLAAREHEHAKGRMGS